MIIRTTSYPRVGLIGNPSDGYYGKTVAVSFDAFRANIELWESPEVELLPSRRDHSVFASVEGLHEDVRCHGYYGGFRLLKATIKVFVDYCRTAGIELDGRNFTLRYSSNIPARVGLAGSSAIITALTRALMGFYSVSIPRHLLANLVWTVENSELGIPSGLQDRVAQAYQGAVAMDFDRKLMETRGYGEYRHLDAGKLPPLYVAYREDLSEGTEVFHNDLRARWNAGEKEVVEAMAYWAELTVAFVKAMEAGDRGRMHELINANFDKRAALYDVGDGNRGMVAIARSVGASAKFAGSGGAIVGIYDDDKMFERLEGAFEPKNIRVLRVNPTPAIAKQ
jgi:glucuronokinase